MKSMDILESRIKEALSRTAQLEAERLNLAEEVTKLREDILKIEREKREIKMRLDQIIEKLELYLIRSEA
jgi:predicted  nucleic acid-binding Zn-ribbon protein